MKTNSDIMIITADKIAAVTNFKPEEIAVIKKTLAKGVTDTELYYFLNVASNVGLNPFNKEIWCYKDHKDNLIVLAGRDGYLKKAQESKKWNGINSAEVCENDFCEIDIANGVITHKPNIKNRGKILGAYAICKPKGVDIPTVEWVDFDTYNKGQAIWKSFPAAMIKKVAEVNVLKKAYGITGLNSEYDFIVDNDDKVIAVTDAIISDGKKDYLFSLINTCSYDDDIKDILEKKVQDLLESEFDTLKYDLINNQKDRIDSGDNYNQTDINKKLDKVI